jgi:hypothetical protein
MKTINPSVTVEGKTIRFGKDFVDALTGFIKSKGTVEMSGVQYLWVSTFSAADTDSFMYRLAESENKRVTGMMSQAI